MKLLPERRDVHVSTHSGHHAGNRMTIYRLKRAGLERDEAIAAAHRKYAADVAMIARQDRPLTLHQAHVAGRTTPSAHATFPWLSVDLRALARRVRHG